MHTSYDRLEMSDEIMDNGGVGSKLERCATMPKCLLLVSSEIRVNARYIVVDFRVTWRQHQCSLEHFLT